MSSDDEDDMIIEGRLYGRYQCPKGHSWISHDASDEPKKCRTKMCDEDADPVNLRPLKLSDIPDSQRLFGKFHCKKCFNQWVSANSWKGYRQQCKSCHTYTKPYELRPLEFRGNVEEENKPHLESLCEKCQKQGYNCRIDLENLHI